MRFDAGWFSKWASAIQSVALTIAVLIGGGWSWWTFRHQENLRALQEQAALDIQVDACQVRVPSDTGLYIKGFVTLRNLGSRNTHLPLEYKGILVSRVTPGEDGGEKFEAPRQTGFFGRPDATPMKQVIVLYGGITRLPFLVQIQKPGIYHVFFFVQRSMPDTIVAERGQVSDGKPWNWVGGTYVVVD